MGFGKMVCDDRKRCGQCYEVKPIAEFASRKTPGRSVNWCFGCRERYRNWSNLTPAERSARKKGRPPESGIGYFVAFTASSKNRKLGAMPSTSTDMASCSDACAFKGNGCYAEFGPSRIWWQKVPERGTSWSDFVAIIRSLEDGTMWRHNEAGDLPGRGDHLDVRALDSLVDANRGKRGFTFTHKPLRTAKERDAIRRANERGFTINLSANNLAHADKLADLAAGPVVVVVPWDAPEKMTTPDGRDVVVCLNETRGLTCSECGLCAVPTRKSVVAFRAHGQAKQLVSEIVRSKRARREAVA